MAADYEYATFSLKSQAQRYISKILSIGFKLDAGAKVVAEEDVLKKIDPMSLIM